MRSAHKSLFNFDAMASNELCCIKYLTIVCCYKGTIKIEMWKRRILVLHELPLIGVQSYQNNQVQRVLLIVTWNFWKIDLTFKLRAIKWEDLHYLFATFHFQVCTVNFFFLNFSLAIWNQYVNNNNYKCDHLLIKKFKKIKKSMLPCFMLKINSFWKFHKPYK